MSKWISTEKAGGGAERIVETMADPERCKHMYNEVCCNEKSQFYGEALFSKDCEMCSLFEAGGTADAGETNYEEEKHS